MLTGVQILEWNSVAAGGWNERSTRCLPDNHRNSKAFGEQPGNLHWGKLVDNRLSWAKNAGWLPGKRFPILPRMKRRKERRIPDAAAPAGMSVKLADRPLLMTMAGGLLLWMSFPPVDWNWLAWIAPIPWLLLIGRQQRTIRREYVWIWCGAVLFWLVLLQGIRKAHWANHFSLLALACYLAAYLPAFVAIVRSAMQHAKVPLFVAAPIVWTGLELLRGYLFTGFSVALLGHTQVDHLWLIQVGDLTGAYGVSFLVMLSAASIVESLPGWRTSRRWLPVGLAIGCVIATCSYGAWRLSSLPQPTEAPLRVALLQGTRDKLFVFSPELERRSFEQYRSLMQRAYDADPHVNLIVWPEGAFTELVPELIVDGPLEVPAGVELSLDEVRARVDEKQQAFAEKVRDLIAEVNPTQPRGNPHSDVHLLVGAASMELQGTETRNYNSALWIAPDGRIAGRYYKMHLVMLGEYIPLLRHWPWLARQTPIGVGVTPGLAPASFDVHGYRLSPSICFECTVPQLMRGHCRQLARRIGSTSGCADQHFGRRLVLGIQYFGSAPGVRRFPLGRIAAAVSGGGEYWNFRRNRREWSHSAATAAPPRRFSCGRSFSRWPIQRVCTLRRCVRRNLLAGQLLVGDPGLAQTWDRHLACRSLIVAGSSAPVEAGTRIPTF